MNTRLSRKRKISVITLLTISSHGKLQRGVELAGLDFFFPSIVNATAGSATRKGRKGAFPSVSVQIQSK